jgi:hypothetical protein
VEAVETDSQFSPTKLAGSLTWQHDTIVEVFVIDDSPEGSAEEAVRRLGNSQISYLKTKTRPADFPVWLGISDGPWRKGPSCTSSTTAT